MPEGISWEDAVAELVRERGLAEQAARLLKLHGKPDAIDRGAIAYGEAKAEYDGVIAGLSVALARGDTPGSLSDLQARLTHALHKREAFCRLVAPLVPTAPDGARSWEIAITGAALVKLIDAIKAIWLRHKDEDLLARKTIETQLAAAIWPAFSAINARR